MRFAYLMGPLDTVVIAKDTSFQLMCAAQERGHQCLHVAQGGLAVREGRVHLLATPLTARRDAQAPFDCASQRVFAAEEIDAVLVRTDPPFDDRYLHDTWLLDLLPPQVPVINSPTGLRTVNEKLWACRFPDLLPPTLITTRVEDYLAFLAEHGEAVIKPTDAFGGQGVFRLAHDDHNARAAFEVLAHGGRRDVVVQRFVPAAATGDKRILLCDGRPLGAVLRVHADHDHRNNFFAGGSAQKAALTDRDRAICDRLAPALRELGLWFVGIDVIGDHLIEVNVTSPTCLQELIRLDQQRYDLDVIDGLAALVMAHRSEDH